MCQTLRKEISLSQVQEDLASIQTSHAEYMSSCKAIMNEQMALHRESQRQEAERLSHMRGVEEDIARHRLGALREAEVMGATWGRDF